MDRNSGSGHFPIVIVIVKKKKTNLVAVVFKDYFLIIGKQVIFHPGLPPQYRGNLFTFRI